MRNRHFIITLVLISILGKLSFCQSIDLEKDLALKLTFDGNALDQSGNNIPTDVIGATLTEDKLGNPDQAYSFDGRDDRIVLNNNTPLITSNTFSICMWAKMNGESFSERVQNIIFEQRDDDTFLASAKSSITLCTEHTKATQLAIRGSIPGEEPVVVECPRSEYNEWHHIVVTFDDHLEAKIYIDATLQSSSTFTGSGNFTTSIDHVDIGTHQYRNTIKGAFFGIIDDVYIYNRAINECEIYYLYRGSLPDER